MDLRWHNGWSEPNKAGLPFIWWASSPPHCPPGLMTPPSAGMTNLSWFAWDSPSFNPEIPLIRGSSQSWANWDDRSPSVPPSPHGLREEFLLLCLPKGDTLPGSLSLGTRTETLKADKGSRETGCSVGNDHLLCLVFSVGSAF